MRRRRQEVTFLVAMADCIHPKLAIFCGAWPQVAASHALKHACADACKSSKSAIYFSVNV